MKKRSTEKYRVVAESLHDNLLQDGVNIEKAMSRIVVAE